MANVCLLPEKVDEFKKALKEKEISIADLLHMTTEERTALLEKYAGENAKAVNTAFEEKLVLRNRIQGIENWASKIGEIGKYSAMGKEDLAKAISDYKARQQERIFSPQENEAFLNDLADKRLGVHISREVAQKIFELSAKADELKGKDQKLSGFSDEYIQARQELNKYVDSQKPLSITGSILKNLAIIGRNNLLLNPSTPIKAISGQIVNGTMDFITRRIGNLSIGGGNPDLVKTAKAEAWETYKKTGVNTAAMTSIDDTHMLGKGENFKLPTGETKDGMMGKVEAGVRKTAEISNKVAIDWEHNLAFTKFYQTTFFDTANIVSANLAKGEGLQGTEHQARAAEIMADASRIEPQTKEGAMVRLEAQAQAARITSTNETLLSRFALGAKSALNKMIPGFPVGDLIMPIAKIPADIIANGIDNAGAGVPRGVVDIFQGRQKIQSEDLTTRYEGMVQFANGIQRLARITGTLSMAALIASQFTKKDFKSDQYGAHFVRIGNTWINTEYVAAINPALAGFMAIKAGNQKGPIAAGAEYVAGAASSLKAAPGIDEANSLVTSISNSNFTKGIQKYATDFFTSRGEPAFLKNLMQGRPINRLFFGAHGVESEQQVKEDSRISAAKRKK